MVIDGKQITKVVHVHFIHGRACLSKDGSKYLNDKVLIVRSHLLR